MPTSGSCYPWIEYKHSPFKPTDWKHRDRAASNRCMRVHLLEYPPWMASFLYGTCLKNIFLTFRIRKHPFRKAREELWGVFVHRFYLFHGTNCFSKWVRHKPKSPLCPSTRALRILTISFFPKTPGVRRFDAKKHQNVGFF